MQLRGLPAAQSAGRGQDSSGSTAWTCALSGASRGPSPSRGVPALPGHCLHTTHTMSLHFQGEVGSPGGAEGPWAGPGLDHRTHLPSGGWLLLLLSLFLSSLLLFNLLNAVGRQRGRQTGSPSAASLLKDPQQPGLGQAEAPARAPPAPLG